MKAYIHDLNAMYRSCPALYAMDGNSDGFEWIQFTNYDENIVAFLRKTEKMEETLLIVCNFSPVSYDSYQVVCLLLESIKRFLTVIMENMVVWVL